MLLIGVGVLPRLQCHCVCGGGGVDPDAGSPLLHRCGNFAPAAPSPLIVEPHLDPDLYASLVIYDICIYSVCVFIYNYNRLVQIIT